MSRLSRITQLIFGSTATTNQLKVFGSLAASAPTNATNIGTGTGGVQNLSNYLAGWYAAVIGSASPTIQDMNSLFWMITSQLAYILQSGVPEWDSATTYYGGNIATDDAGNLYFSLIDNNLNNALTDVSAWQITTRSGVAGQFSTVSYSIGDIVNDLGVLYVSQQNSNLNQLLSNKAYWLPLCNTGVFAPTITWSGTTPSDYAGRWTYIQTGNIVTVYGTINFTAPSGSATTISSITVPVATSSLSTTIGGIYTNGTSNGSASGIVKSNSGSGTTVAVSPPLAIPPTDNVSINFDFNYTVS